MIYYFLSQYHKYIQFSPLQHLLFLWRNIIWRIFNQVRIIELYGLRSLSGTAFPYFHNQKQSQLVIIMSLVRTSVSIGGNSMHDANLYCLLAVYSPRLPGNIPVAPRLVCNDIYVCVWQGDDSVLPQLAPKGTLSSLHSWLRRS